MAKGDLVLCQGLFSNTIAYLGPAVDQGQQPQHVTGTLQTLQGMCGYGSAGDPRQMYRSLEDTDIQKVTHMASCVFRP